MAINNPSSGFFGSNEYVASPLPWALTDYTSGTSVNAVSFHKVTKNITVHNHGATGEFIRIGFSKNGVNAVGDDYYFLLNGGKELYLDVRVIELFIRADTSNSIRYSVYAGLTLINQEQMPLLTGSYNGTNIWDGVG